MYLLNLFWPDLICLAIVCVLVNGAIAGKFYSHGRGGPPKLIASMKSHRLRLVFLRLAAGLSVWVIIDLKHKYSIANGLSGSVTFQPSPLLGSTVVKSPGSPSVVGPSVGSRIPVSFGASYNFPVIKGAC